MLLGLLIGGAGVPALRSPADETGHSAAGAGDDAKSIARLLQRYCFECHDAGTQEADVRLDSLDLETDHREATELLERMLGAVDSEAMPPEDAEIPTAGERARLVSWMKGRLTESAEAARRSGRWTRNRRLTVEEYNFTMQTLLAVDAEFADMLTADPISESGYRNDSERLGLSSLQIESYLDSARRAAARYVMLGTDERLPLRYHIELEELFYSTADRYQTRKRAPQPVDASTFAARRELNRSSEPKFVDPLGPKLAGAFSDDEQLAQRSPS